MPKVKGSKSSPCFIKLLLKQTEILKEKVPKVCSFCSI
nr:MAG TPA: hypothetical protein [Caudoviricetes sp.]